MTAIPRSVSTQAPNTNARTTVIVGAGIIGLSTAFHLATRNGKNTGHRIIVIDIQKHPFAAASRYNSGILSYQWCSGDLRDFAEYCYTFYEDLGSKDSDFRDQTAYRQNSNFRLAPGNSPSVVGVPDWVAVPEGWHVDRDPKDGRAATINPIGLGSWLLQSCQQNGVEVYNLARVVKAQISKSGTLDRVDIERGGQITELPCHDLVFAAGAWTPRFFKEIFPNSNLGFYPTTNSGNWVVVKNPSQKRSIALGQVIFDDVVGHQLEFVARDDKTIWISGLSNTKTPLGDVRGKVSPDDKAISRLLSYPKRFLVSGASQQPLSLCVLETGRTFRPTIDRELPIITRVEASNLGTANNLEKSDPQDKEGDKGGGVFLCSGHGKYGVTLGMGSGRLASQIIMGDRPDIDMSKFDLPSQQGKT